MRSNTPSVWMRILLPAAALALAASVSAAISVGVPPAPGLGEPAIVMPGASVDAPEGDATSTPPPPSPPAAAPAQAPPAAAPSGAAPSAPPPAAAPVQSPAATTGLGDEEIRAGQESLQAGDLTGAKVRFEKALALDPNNEFVRSRLAYIKFRKADYAGAAADAEAAVQLDPADSLSSVILGRSREALGDPARALAAYTAAIEQAAKARTAERVGASAFARYLRAEMRITRGESMDVEEDLKEVLRLLPKHGYAQYELALFLLKAGRTSEAMEEFSRAEEIVPTFQPQESWLYPTRRYFFIDDNMKFWSGVTFRQVGKSDEALAKFEPLLAKVESLAGSTLAPKIGGAAGVLAGQIETSFYNVQYEAALACEAKGDKARAQALLKSLLKVNLADAETQRLAKEMQKRLK